MEERESRREKEADGLWSTIKKQAKCIAAQLPHILAASYWFRTTAIHEEH